MTGKSQLKISKLSARLKNETWNNIQIKNHKKSHELRLIKPQTQHKNINVFLIHVDHNGMAGHLTRSETVKGF
jgi:hypothetical protein